MAKAVIGISASEVTIQSGPFMGEPRTYVNAAYVDSVLKNGTNLEKIMGESSLMTNSFHHQLIKAVAPDLTESASASDGVTEALESTDGKVIAVQWHPEEMHANPAPEAAIMNRLFKYLIDKAEEEKQ